jgi:hypothetical protein
MTHSDEPSDEYEAIMLELGLELPSLSEVEPLLEVKLSPKETGVPNLRIEVRKVRTRHAASVKLHSLSGQSVELTVPVHDPRKVTGEVKVSNGFPSGALDDVAEFLQVNQDTIINFWNGDDPDLQTDGQVKKAIVAIRRSHQRKKGTP